MEYFWKENKRFVVAVAGAALLTLFYHGFVLSPLRKGEIAAVQTREKEKKALEARMANGVPSVELLGDLQRDADLKKKSLAAVAGDVSFKVGEAFTPPSKGGAKERYDQVKVDLDRELRSKAAGKMDLPKSIGIETTDATEETAHELLLRLAVVERLVEIAAAAKVEKIEVIDALSGMGSGEAKKGVFLSAYPVFMKFRGSEKAVFSVLHAVQKKGQFFAVTQFQAQKEDLGKDVVGGSIGVALLRVDEKSPIEAKGAQP